MSYIVEPRVLEVLDDKRAIVSTRGLRRVVIEPGHEVLAEFVSPSQAKSMADYFNGSGDPGKRAVVKRYAKQRAAANPPFKPKRSAAVPFRSAK